MDPAAFGLGGGRRRTPGLRREEVAQRANISPTWYSWLEQGRGGAPSADVLDRLAKGLMLTGPEREHLFILGLGRPPATHYARSDGVTPRLQRVLDALPRSPAIIKTATWDVVAWNAAAAALLTDYAKLPPEERNVLRLMFTNTRTRAAQDDWRTVARYVVSAFRADAARAGAGNEITRLVEELSRLSPEFEALWRENDVAGHADGLKRLRHPEHGLIELEFSMFGVDGRPDLGMLVYNPASAESARRIDVLMTEANRSLSV
ncbi:helix-turn-helix transcriptional regulator [Sphingomonas sp. HT-1]|nr:XRE family transcriptional regulator [Sphingomonas sp. WG]